METALSQCFNPLNSGATHSTAEEERMEYKMLGYCFNPLNSGATHSTWRRVIRSQTASAACFNPLNSGATHSTNLDLMSKYLANLIVSIPSIAGQRIRPRIAPGDSGTGAIARFQSPQ